eukprot:29549-Eustigmatos_ZCMA.PRE.1
MKHAVGSTTPSLDGRFKLSRTLRFAMIEIGRSNQTQVTPKATSGTYVPVSLTRLNDFSTRIRC